MDEAQYKRAMELALPPHGKPSTAYVQRKLQCGYNAAGEMLERMVKEGHLQTYGGRRNPPEGATP